MDGYRILIRWRSNCIVCLAQKKNIVMAVILTENSAGNDAEVAAEVAGLLKQIKQEIDEYAAESGLF